MCKTYNREVPWSDETANTHSFIDSHDFSTWSSPSRRSEGSRSNEPTSCSIGSDGLGGVIVEEARSV